MKRENNQLKEQVEQWKGKLISAEKSSGIQQITTSVPEAGEPQQAKSEGNFELTSDIFGVYLLLRCWHNFRFRDNENPWGFADHTYHWCFWPWLPRGTTS